MTTLADLAGVVAELGILEVHQVRPFTRGGERAWNACESRIKRDPFPEKRPLRGMPAICLSAPRRSRCPHAGDLGVRVKARSAPCYSANSLRSAWNACESRIKRDPFPEKRPLPSATRPPL